MNDETWLRELAQAAKEEEESDRMQLDERWDRLAAGSLSAEETEELRALAETDPEARQAYEAFRPLGPEFKERTLQALREKIAPPVPLRFEPKPPAPPRPLPLPWRSRRWAGGVAAAAAAAAAVVAWLGPFGTPRIGALVAYGVSAGDQPRRSSEPSPMTSVPVYHAGSDLHFSLESKVRSKAFASPLVVECYLSTERELRRWEGCAKLAVVGELGRTVRVEGTIGDTLPLEPGEWRLSAVVGREGKLPGVEELRGDLLGDPARPCSADDQVGGRNWSAVCVQPLRMEGSP